MESHLNCGCVETTKRGHIHTKLCHTHHAEVFSKVWSSDLVLTEAQQKRNAEQVKFGLKRVI